MKVITLDKWKKFKMSDLFDIRPTKAYKKINRDLFEVAGSNPVIVNSSYNNGIGGYTSLPNTEKGNILTFSDTTTSKAIFYQEFPFVGYPHVQGVFPKVFEEHWNKKTWLFFLAAFKKAAIGYGFDYVNKFTRELALNMEIYLPISQDGAIDWEFMSSYVDNMFELQDKRLKQLIAIQPNFHKVTYFSPHPFSLSDIFHIDMGTKLDKVKMSTENPEINFVGRASENQGVTGKVNRINGLEPYKEGNLTLALGGAYLGSCFVQRNDFYTSQNVIVLIPKKDLTLETKLFISTTIFRESQLHYKAFIDELNRHIKKDFRIILPSVAEEGVIVPDYKFMHDFFSKILIRQKENLNSIITPN